MQERHSNKSQYFREQIYTTNNFVIPYVREYIEFREGTTVLEIGCGEGGNLQPFLNLGCKVCGIDISEGKIKLAKEYFKDHPKSDNINFICEDIYKIENFQKFDFIFMRDVIEHIPNQNRFMEFVKHFMHEKSVMFVAFPPWQNPFGGHQQMCQNKLLSKLPYFHLLPKFAYRALLKAGKETSAKIRGLEEIKETGISLERFERIVKRNGFKTLKKTHYFINPNYQIKFNLKPRKQSTIISAIPWVRNFFTTAGYYLIGR